jgi:hypothetical protein
VARVAATDDPSRDGGAQIATADVRISAADYAPVPDYPIRPQRHSNVRMADQFWKPRILRNAEVTIPFEMQKLAELERGFSVNVLEAAILSLAMHPDARLQAEVDAQVRAAAVPRAEQQLEVAATLRHDRAQGACWTGRSKERTASTTTGCNPPFSAASATPSTV